MDLIDYVGSLPPIKIVRLYENHFICLAILRSLSPVAKQYVFRFLYVESGIPEGLVASWHTPAGQSKHDLAIATLARLQMLTPSPGAEPAYVLNKSFGEHLRSAVSSSLSKYLDRVSDHVYAAVPSKQAADDYAMQQWETLLLYAVGGGPSPVPPAGMKPAVPLDLGRLLLQAGIITIDETTGSHSVTQTGFQFLLAGTYTQIWQLLREYISSAERQSAVELGNALGFLLQLGFQGEAPIRCSGLSALQQDIAAHMAQLGVLNAFRVEKDLWLLPTRLAVLLASGTGSNIIGSEYGFIIVETNFRVYAYTSSAVRQAILRLFMRCDVLLPNLFVGTITRENVTAALESGVTAEQIVGYLRQHAHPRVANRVPIVPSVVADQIRLWQRDLQRLSDRPTVMYKNFENSSLFTQVAAFAESLGAVLVRNDKQGELVVAGEYHDKVRDKIKDVKRQLGLG